MKNEGLRSQLAKAFEANYPHEHPHLSTLVTVYGVRESAITNWHQLSAVNLLPKAASLSNLLKLLTDYRSVKAIDGDVKPIALFTFHHKVSKTCGIGRVVARLRDQVDK